jgi:hypothetical protein
MTPMKPEVPNERREEVHRLFNPDVLRCRCGQYAEFEIVRTGGGRRRWVRPICAACLGWGWPEPNDRITDFGGRP